MGKDGRGYKIQLVASERRGWSYRKIAQRFGISVGLAHELVKTDLQRWKARAPRCPLGSDEVHLHPHTELLDDPRQPPQSPMPSASLKVVHNAIHGYINKQYW